MTRPKLEQLRDKLPEGPAKELVEKVLADPDEAAFGLLMVAMRLGAAEEWHSPAGYLEEFAEEVAVSHLPDPGKAGSMVLYRQIADAVGYDYDGAGRNPGEDDDEADEDDAGWMDFPDGHGRL